MRPMSPISRIPRRRRAAASLLTALLAIAVVSPVATASSVPMVGKWEVGSFQLNGRFKVVRAAPLQPRGVTFAFLDRPDTIFVVTDNPVYRGTLLGDLTGASLAARIGVDVSAGSEFEYFGEPDGSGVGATVRLYFETTTSLGEITCPCQDKGNASFWYSSPIFVELDALKTGDVTLAVSLVPSMWADAQERAGDADALQAALFAQAVKDVGTVGLSFGGGRHFHNGAGIRSGTGTGSFRLVSYEVSQD
jgi:hypothetical protein